ncbi:MAG: ADP-ribosyl-[dinitrogen reductase] hydrolase [Betaproteobacteria bacterium]|nr:ADP-ribosyl-[dinitrogen reductase] hydrolase [Betaproteobacteria bacterium]
MRQSDDTAGVLQRARGAYLGLAVGDALGATVEFLTPGEIARAFGVHRDLVGGGWLRLKPGQVTDDTQMSLALGEAILEARGFHLKTVADHFLAWLKSKPVDVGNTCRRGIGRYLRDGSLESPFNEGDAGNGACMRNLPVALYALHDDAAFARASIEQCHFTHNHPLSDAAVLALGRMTRALVLGGTREDCRAIADALVAVHRTFRFEPYPRRTTGYVVDTVQTVLHGFFTTGSFEDCLVKVVNLGGDADTNGALAGMLAGALYGEAAIPRRWLRRLDPGVRKRIEGQAGALVTGPLARRWADRD